MKGDTSGCSLGFVDKGYVFVYGSNTKEATFVLMPTTPREQPDVSPCRLVSNSLTGPISFGHNVTCRVHCTVLKTLVIVTYFR